MATAPTKGLIYFIESDDTDNDDWITDHAGDPDLLDLDQYTEGTEYCQINIPENFLSKAHTGMVVTDTGSGESYVFRSERRGYQDILKGLQTSRANAKLIDQFLMSDRHTSGKTATFKKYYLIFYFGVNDHWPFTDNSGTQQSYCMGVVLNFDIGWRETASQVVNVSINWRSVWQ